MASRGYPDSTAADRAREHLGLLRKMYVSLCGFPSEAYMTKPQFLPEQAATHPISCLSSDGSVSDGPEGMLSDDEMFEALEQMWLSRRFDKKAFSLQRQGRFGTFSPAEGQEASLVGTAMALDPAVDWVVPQYRELPALLRQGLPLRQYVLYHIGHPAGGLVPHGINVLPIQISLAAQLPHAVGLAWGLRHRGQDSVVVVFCGDGATSEGDFHEAANFAGVMNAPVIFLVQNNGWAISTPRQRQSAAASLASRAVGYGLTGTVVDGNDLVAVHSVVSSAVSRARQGEGASIIESITYRMGPHNTADDPTRYRDDEALQEWRERDPIVRVQRYLTARGRWDDDTAKRLDDEADARIDEALQEAWALDPPTDAALFEHVYAEEPPRLKAQRQALSGTQGQQP